MVKDFPFVVFKITIKKHIMMELFYCRKEPFNLPVQTEDKKTPSREI